MALDFSKLTSVVKSVADLAASHASLSTLAADAKAYAADVETKALAKLDGLVAEVEAKAQAEIDSLTASIEAALGVVAPLDHVEAVGLTAVAEALSAPPADYIPASLVFGDAPLQAEPIVLAPQGDPLAPLLLAPAAPERPVPQTVEEYNAMRKAGLLP